MAKLPDGLPLIRVECEAAAPEFVAGEAFWEGLDERIGALDLDRILDEAMAGRAAPRVWVLAHEPGRSEAAVAGALGLARALARRGQATLVIDGDDQTAALSGWSGRKDVEGWIDVVRYGTSVVASAVPLPFAGRTSYLMGIGSYAPTEATAAEISQLVARLRHQADDLLVVLPAGAGTALWGPQADIRIYCHDLADPEARLASDVAVLSGGGFVPTSLLGLGEPAVPTAEPEPGPEPALEPAPEPAPPVWEDDAAATEAAASATEDAAVVDARSVPDAAADAAEANGSVSEALAALATEDGYRLPPSEEEEERSGLLGTSGVFWLIAIVATVLIALVTVYYVKFVRVTEQDLFGGAPLEVARNEAPPLRDYPVIVDSAALAAADTAALDLAAVDTNGGAASWLDSLGQVPTGTTGAGDGAVEIAAPETGPDAAAGGTEQEAIGSEPRDATAQAAPDPAESADEGPAQPEFDPAPYAVPAGRDGWALQVYSFRDNTSAGVEAARLERRGMRAAVRQVDVPGKGLWWRVYVGSFASRQDATRAMPALYEKLRIDWANPTRFTVSAADTAGR